MKKDKKLMLLVLTIIILIFTGCTSTTGGRTYQECYYGDDGEEVCVNKYVPEEPDIEPRYGW